MQKSMQKSLAMLVMTIMVAVTISGFVSATDSTVDNSDICTYENSDLKFTCDECSCDKDCCLKQETCETQIEPKCEEPKCTPPVEQKCTSTLGDRVWNDSNANGIQDADEKGIADVTVNLWEGDANEPIKKIATTKTDVNGIYYFKNLVAGIYWLEFKLPTATDGTWKFSPQNQGTDSTVDSDPNASGIAGPICLKCCTCDPTWDTGLIFDPAAAGGEEEVPPAAAGGDESEVTPVAAASEETIAMQETGVPIALLIMSVLMVLAGLAIPKRK